MYRSLSAIVAQPKNCPFGVNATIRLEDIIIIIIIIYLFIYLLDSG